MSNAGTAAKASADCASVDAEPDFAPDAPVTSYSRTEGDEGRLVTN